MIWLLKLKESIKEHDFAWKFKLIICLPIIIFLIAIDWISKAVVAVKMTQGSSFVVIKDFLTFRYEINPGSAYNTNANNVGLAIGLAFLVTLGLILVVLALNEKKILVSLSIILSGSIANLVARAWAPAIIGGQWNGQKWGVIDFIHFNTPIFNSENYIFNFADVWVNLGVALLIIILLIEITIWIIEIIKKQTSIKNKQLIFQPTLKIEKTSIQEISIKSIRNQKNKRR